MTDTAPQTDAPRRPVLVWVMFLFYMSNLCLYAVGVIWLTLSGEMVLNEVLTRSLRETSAFEYIPILVVNGLNFAAFIQIFRLKKICVPLFCWAFGLTLLTTILEAAIKGWAAMPARPDSTYLGWLISNAFCMYAWRLRQEGVLR